MINNDVRLFCLRSDTDWRANDDHVFRVVVFVVKAAGVALSDVLFGCVGSCSARVYEIYDTPFGIKANAVGGRVAQREWAGCAHGDPFIRRTEFCRPCERKAGLTLICSAVSHRQKGDSPPNGFGGYNRGGRRIINLTPTKIKESIRPIRCQSDRLGILCKAVPLWG